jgi:maltose alpha-D-glucosyltransferase/alpha-amylase
MLTDRGIRRRLAPLVDGDRGLLEMCTVPAVVPPGVPILYYGDEIGMGENLSLPGCMAIRDADAMDRDRGGGFLRSEADGSCHP